MADFLLWFRERWDSVVLSDHEWKKKYCPHLYSWLFEMTEEEKNKVMKNIDGTGNYIKMLKNAGHCNQTIIDHLANCGKI